VQEYGGKKLTTEKVFFALVFGQLTEKDWFSGNQSEKQKEIVEYPIGMQAFDKICENANGSSADDGCQLALATTTEEK